MFKANIITGGSPGLLNDATILRDALDQFGASGRIVRKDNNSLNPARRYPLLYQRVMRPFRTRPHLNFHVEHIHSGWAAEADCNVWLPNQDMHYNTLARDMSMVDHVLCKTRIGHEIYSRLHNNCHYVGFISRDCKEQHIKKDFRKCLHVMGRSNRKGTKTLLDVWVQHPEWPELHVLFGRPTSFQVDWLFDFQRSNISLIEGPVAEDRLRLLQNTCGLHLCPSEIEGFGHYISEAISTGAVVVTTDAPPMNEYVNDKCGYLVKYSKSEPFCLGKKYFVDRGALEETLTMIFSTPSQQFAEMSQSARARFEEMRDSFQLNFRNALAEIVGSSSSSVVG